MNEHKWTKYFIMQLKHKSKFAYKSFYTNRNIFVWFNESFDSWVSTLRKPKGVVCYRMSYKKAHEFISAQNNSYHEMINSFKEDSSERHMDGYNNS